MGKNIKALKKDYPRTRRSYKQDQYIKKYDEEQQIRSINISCKSQEQQIFHEESSGFQAPIQVCQKKPSQINRLPLPNTFQDQNQLKERKIQFLCLKQAQIIERGINMFQWKLSSKTISTVSELISQSLKRARSLHQRIIRKLIEKNSQCSKELMYCCNFCQRKFSKACALGGHIASLHSDKRRSLKKISFKKNQDDQSNKIYQQTVKIQQQEEEEPQKQQFVKI